MSTLNGTDELIVRVHGTGAGRPLDEGPAWWQNGGEFHLDLERRLAGVASCFPRAFHWSGKNSELDRQAAAEVLLDDWLLAFERHGRPYHLIGHSHGGSVVWAALRAAERRKLDLKHLKTWTTVGTPFLHFRPDRRDYFLTVFAGLFGVIFATLGYLCWGAWNRDEFAYYIFFASLPIALTVLPYCLFRAVVYGRACGAARADRRWGDRAFRRYGARWNGLHSRYDEAIQGLRSSPALSGEIMMRFNNWTGPVVERLIAQAVGAGEEESQEAARRRSPWAFAWLVPPIVVLLPLALLCGLSIFFQLLTWTSEDDASWKKNLLHLFLPTLGLLVFGPLSVACILRGVRLLTASRRERAGPTAGNDPASWIRAHGAVIETPAATGEAVAAGPAGAVGGRLDAAFAGTRPSRNDALIVVPFLLSLVPVALCLLPILILVGQLIDRAVTLSTFLLGILTPAIGLAVFALAPAAYAMRIVGVIHARRRRAAWRSAEDPASPDTWVPTDGRHAEATGFVRLGLRDSLLLPIREIYGTLHNLMLAPVVDGFIWQRLQRKSQGNDRAGLVLWAVTETPVPAVACASLHEQVEGPILARADENTGRALSRLRVSVGALATSGTNIAQVAEAIQHQEIFTWKELIHNTYFDFDSVRGLIAGAIAGTSPPAAHAVREARAARPGRWAGLRDAINIAATIGVVTYLPILFLAGVVALTVAITNFRL